MRIPFGIETVTKVPVQRQLKMEFGFRTLRAGVSSTYAPPSRGDRVGEALMLTGDLNVAMVEWIVQYRIKDPKAFLFHVRNVAEHLPRHVRGGDARGGRATTASTRC